MRLRAKKLGLPILAASSLVQRILGIQLVKTKKGTAAEAMGKV